jgi:hypothetical protein
MSGDYDMYFSNPKLFPSSIPQEDIDYLRATLDDLKEYDGESEDDICECHGAELEWFELLSKTIEGKGKNMEEQEMERLSDLIDELTDHYVEQTDEGVNMPSWLSHQLTIASYLVQSYFYEDEEEQPKETTFLPASMVGAWDNN